MTQETVVCDASALIAMLLDGRSDGARVYERLKGRELAAPAMVDFEVSNVIRRKEMAGHVSADVAAQAHADLLQLPIERWPYELIGPRVWQLRHHLSAYDASYVAVAELVDASLVTLDARLARTHGLRCRVEVP